MSSVNTSPTASGPGRFARALVAFNRPRPVRYFGVDLAIFGFPLVASVRGLVPEGDALVATASMLSARCGGLTLDDYFDHETDAVENPERPIPAGFVSRREALWMGVTALALGLLLAAAVGSQFLAAVVAAYAAIVLGFAAGARLSVPGATTVATVTSVSMLSVMGWSAFGDLSTGLVAVFAATWCWDLAHDTVGAYLDREGDEVAGLATLGVVLDREHVAAVTLVALTASAGVVVAEFATGVALAAVSGALLVGVGVAVRRFLAGTDDGHSLRTAVEWFVVVNYASATLLLLR